MSQSDGYKFIWSVKGNISSLCDVFVFECLLCCKVSIKWFDSWIFFVYKCIKVGGVCTNKHKFKNLYEKNFCNLNGYFYNLWFIYFHLASNKKGFESSH